MTNGAERHREAARLARLARQRAELQAAEDRLLQMRRNLEGHIRRQGMKGKDEGVAAMRAIDRQQARVERLREAVKARTNDPVLRQLLGRQR